MGPESGKGSDPPVEGCAGGEIDIDATRVAEVRLVADQKAVELGFDPETTRPEVLRELRPYDHAFLDEEGIDERDSLWAVNYAPPATFVLEGQEYATAGGDLTVYVHVPSRRVVAYWLGE